MFINSNNFFILIIFYSSTDFVIQFTRPLLNQKKCLCIFLLNSIHFLYMFNVYSKFRQIIVYSSFVLVIVIIVTDSISSIIGAGTSHTNVPTFYFIVEHPSDNI